MENIEKYKEIRILTATMASMGVIISAIPWLPWIITVIPEEQMQYGGAGALLPIMLMSVGGYTSVLPFLIAGIVLSILLWVKKDGCKLDKLFGKIFLVTSAVGLFFPLIAMMLNQIVNVIF